MLPYTIQQELFIFQLIFQYDTASFLRKPYHDRIFFILGGVVVEICEGICFFRQQSFQFNLYLIKGGFASAERHHDAALRFTVMVLPDCPSGRIKAGRAEVIEIHGEIVPNTSVLVGDLFRPSKILFIHALEDGIIERSAPA